MVSAAFSTRVIVVLLCPYLSCDRLIDGWVVLWCLLAVVRHCPLALAELLAVVSISLSIHDDDFRSGCAPTYVDDSAAIATDPVKRIWEIL